MVSIWWAYLSGQWNVESGNAAATDAGLVAEADKKLTEACTAVFKAYLKQPVINPPGNDVAAPAYQSAAQDFNIIPSLALTAPRF